MATTIKKIIVTIVVLSTMLTSCAQGKNSGEKVELDKLFTAQDVGGDYHVTFSEQTDNEYTVEYRVEGSDRLALNFNVREFSSVSDAEQEYSQIADPAMQEIDGIGDRAVYYGLSFVSLVVLKDRFIFTISGPNYSDIGPYLEYAQIVISRLP